MPDQGTLILVLGLAGSGKSYLIDRIKRDGDYVCEEGFAADNVEGQNFDNLAKKLRAGDHCIVSELKYMNPVNRDRFLDRVLDAVNPEPRIHFICFEKDIKKANHNCRVRGTKKSDPDGNRHVDINEAALPAYEIPEGAIVVQIHQLQS